jgi:hypothetical protein
VTQVPQLSRDEVDRLLEEAVRKSDGAIHASNVAQALPKGLRPPPETIKERLAQLARDGRVHRWPRGRSPHYAARPYAEELQEWLLETLAAKPQTAPQLRKLKSVPPAATKIFSAVLADLTRTGKVFKHPTLDRVQRYSTHPPDALEYIRGPLDSEIKKLQKKGFTEEALLDALRRYSGGTVVAPMKRPGVDGTSRSVAGERVLAALEELNPKVRDGDLVYIPHLRQALAADLPDKLEFNKAVLALNAQGRVQLQSHPVPSQLNDHEKESMIPDGRGSWYMAIGLRRT